MKKTKKLTDSLTNKINSTIFNARKRIVKIQYDVARGDDRVWIYIYMNSSIFLDELKKLEEMFKDHLITTMAEKDNLFIMIEAKIE